MNAVPWASSTNIALLADLYEFTMADALIHARQDETATFELFVRSLPGTRNFLVACGIDDAIDLALGARFDTAAVEALRGLGLLSDAVLDRLAGLRFSGDIWAVEEGQVVFANEPLLRVTAPIVEALLLETLLLNTVLFQTMVASKAARVAIACRGRPFADFSARRDHGADAALKAARAAFIGGAASTSNVLAASIYGIPASGTMAHAFVLAFDDEEAAFRAYAERFGEAAILLIDTYDVARGAMRAARVSADFLARGTRLRGVRLDSGNLAGDARIVRAILDEAGQAHLRIFASGDLDEDEIDALLAAGAPIDSFGVGTRLGTSADAPSLSGVYKLVADAGVPRAKFSAGKHTFPGPKQVYRQFDAGMVLRDLLVLHNEPAEGEPLLRQVVRGGERIEPAATIQEARARAGRNIAALPGPVRALAAASPPFPVVPSERLLALTREIEERVQPPIARSGGGSKIRR